MTIDKAKLKDLAQAVAELEDIPERQDEHAEAVAYLETHMHCHTILALLAEIDRLERKNDNQAESIREYQDLTMGGDVSLGMLKADLRVTAGERDQLKADNEALRKDAERYRWLTSPAVYNGTLGIADGWIDFECKIEAQQQIDAAMAKEASHA
ncbi:hypothetical protein [Pseudomonas sp. C5pp]|uniref:hypothetical protein n=1 Tax=Pseudomonas sp. C5pp TaxID=1586081 RepID=UPI0005809C74|nr:hypothetical protein [Pseudomonas sp. C5pp]KIC79344.1 hypothetical protein RR51_27260 [Pseudomonas sp. C5pp]